MTKGGKGYCDGLLCLATWETGEGEICSGLAVSVWKVERLGDIGRNRARLMKMAEIQRQA